MSTEPRHYGDPGTRVRILDATWELLEERGSDLRLADVAERTGVSRQAVYLHFGNRAALLVALVDHIDTSLGADDLRAKVFGAPSGEESLHRWVEIMSWYQARIDAATLALEGGRHHDEAMAAAWRDRMERRRGMLRAIVDRIAGEGRLAEGWTQETAAQLAYVTTQPGPWRELTRELGWSSEEYAERVWRLLERALIT